MRYVDLGAVTAAANNPKDEPKKPGRFKPLVFLVVFGLLFLFLAGTVRAVNKGGIAALLHPVSIVASFVNTTPLKDTDGRVNTLILGLDRREDSDTAGLTDTLLVLSVEKDGNDAVMLSLPRDLWVKSPNQTYSKLNEVYALSGREEVVKTIENVLGIPIHYYAIVDFEAFKKVVEIVDGIDVNVQNSFDDYYYPIAGMENAEPESARYKHVHFDSGLQHMDGDTALIFSRSRKAEGDEGTDFARAKRQQLVILAIRDKILSLETLSNPAKIKELYDTYQSYVETNVDFAEAQKFYEVGSKLGFNNLKSIVLDDRSEEGAGGLLYEPEDKTLYRNSYVLIPRAGDFSQIHAFVQKLLFGEK